MRRDILNKLIVVLMLTTGIGCKAKKELAKAPAASTKIEELTAFSKSGVLKDISSKQLDFSTIQLKAKANLSINNRGNDASMNIRIKKDEAVWVSVTVIAGLEVGRALITRDSIKIMNKIESTYIARPFNYINQFTNRQINFNTLQALLIGNTIPEFISDQSDIRFQDNRIVLSGILQDLVYSVNYDTNTKVVQTNLNNESQKLTASYSDFYPISDQAIPHEVNISSAADKNNIAVQLRYTQVILNEKLEFPFNVPKRFTEIN